MTNVVEIAASGRTSPWASEGVAILNALVIVPSAPIKTYSED